MFVRKGLMPGVEPKDVFENHEKIWGFLSNYKNKETLRSYLQAMFAHLKRNGPIAEYVVRKYVDCSYKIMVETYEEYRKNAEIEGMDPKNRLDYDYDALGKLLGDLEKIFWVNVPPITDNQHNLMLILALNVLQPPLRAEIATMIYTEEPCTLLKCETKQNYLVKNTSMDTYYYRMCNYKTKVRYGCCTIELQNKRLKKLLDESFKRHPRKDVLVPAVMSGKVAESFGYNRYNMLLKNELGAGACADWFRALYIAKFIRSNPNFKQKEVLAKQMLHTQHSQMLFYNKITNGRSTVSDGSLLEEPLLEEHADEAADVDDSLDE